MAASAGPSLTDKLSNIQHMPSLIAATVASEKPTDGYLIRDIIKMSYESLQTRVFLQKYLTNLLDTSRNVYVKIKVLKLVFTLLEEGHPEFHRNLQKMPEPFKAASMLKASNADLAGDCGRIRDLANKVLDKVFEEPPAERACPYGLQSKGSPSMSNQTGSSSSYSSSGETSSALLGGGDTNRSGVGGRIQGFGNTANNTSTDSNSLSSQLTSAVGSLFGSIKPKERNVAYDKSYATMSSVPQFSSGLGGVGGGASGATYQHSHKQGSTSLLAGGGKEDWADDTGERETPDQRYNGSGQFETTPTVSASVGQNEQEKRLVDEITAPAGVRVAPTKEMMASFISRCKSLDCLAVVECLKEKLVSDSNQTVLKALFAIEGLVKSDVPDVLSFLDLTLDELNHLTTSPQASIKAKATKLLTQLSAIEASTGTQENGNQSLLILGGADDTPDETEPKVPQSNDMAGLFAGLTLTTAASSSQSAAPRVTPPARTTNLIGDLTELSKPVVPVSRPVSSLPVSQATPTSSDNLLDFGESDDVNFDPLQSAAVSVSTNSSFLTELTSLDQPAAIPTEPLLPMATEGQPSPPQTSGFSMLTGDNRPSLMTSGSPMMTSGPSMMTSGSPMMTSGSPMMTSGPSMMASGPSLMTSGPSMMASGPSLMTSGPSLMTSGPSMMTSGSPMMTGMAMSGQPIGGGQGYTVQPPPGTSYYPLVSNRPVQRLPPKDETGDSGGFGFLSKSGKGSAFDFVQDEMKASMGTK